MPYRIHTRPLGDGSWQWRISGRPYPVCVSWRTYATRRAAMQAAYKFVKQLRLRGATAEQ